MHTSLVIHCDASLLMSTWHSHHSHIEPLRCAYTIQYLANTDTTSSDQVAALPVDREPCAPIFFRFVPVNSQFATLHSCLVRPIREASPAVPSSDLSRPAVS